ncbi:zinc finger 260-like [Paramuricea clavata]|uniref:Zinc finger 260-like n=1 Tax=Paramuricea clavata TaxID=317549 RepID=A0A7D9JJV4_PARCT|nr:zinc finger 260-like [Paramuricea clavata]
MWRQIGERRKKWKMKARQTREDLDTEMVQEKLDCEKCGKIVTRSKDPKFHIKGCQQCVCEKCGQKFTHELQLKRHNLKKHSNTFSCKTCGKLFGYKHHLDRHS